MFRAPRGPGRADDLWGAPKGQRQRANATLSSCRRLWAAFSSFERPPALPLRGGCRPPGPPPKSEGFGGAFWGGPGG
eukprot:4064190-Alexandrium_andersonii.AAC.1